MSTNTALQPKARTSREDQAHLDALCVNTIRTLAMDAVQKADSGHPGTPMALAPLAYVLWTKFLRYNPENPRWFDRDRFVLSAGHASMLQYALLFLTGYDLSLEDLQNFRQWASCTPGHPEYGRTPGLDTTTGPLGQGVMNAVGMAIAEAHLAARFNRPGLDLVDHYTYAICSDGDLMEGASHEAASVAGHLKLGKLIFIYDDNHISIEGPTEITFSDDVALRFKGYHWHVQNLGEKANDLAVITRALRRAQRVQDRPSLIILRSHIAYGAPHMQDTKEAHGQALGEEEVRLTKRYYGWPEDRQFYVPDEVLDHMRQAQERGRELEAAWNQRLADYSRQYPDLGRLFEASVHGDLPEDWASEIPEFPVDRGSMATRDAGGKVLNAIARKVPWLVGGSGDLAPSTKTLIEASDYLQAGQYENRNLAWGVREHTMCSSSSGMALHGGIRPYAATFFIFSDYARPAIRLAAMMELPVIYIMTHDSIGLGEDGPTHQPVEHLASFRAMPHMCVIRPADANETAWAWRAAMLRKEGPTMLLLTRQKVPILDRSQLAPAEGLLRGAYILSREQAERPDVILIASGSEVQLIVQTQPQLAEQGIQARVVSMPSWELFEQQDRSYRDEVLPPEVTARLAVEAGSDLGWCKYVTDHGSTITIHRFGASAPAQEVFRQYGFSVENVVARAQSLLGKREG
ncbi:MAG: transketolase [Planctomycetes bacterium]|nr:transketolase [Planctomycetota bacterium]